MVSTAVPIPPSPLPIALVITELEVGGAEQALVNLAINLDRERFLPAIYSLQARPENDLLVRRLEAAEIAVHFLNVQSRWQFFGAVKRIAKLFRQQQPQLVQSFLYHANVVGTMAARRAKVPRVATGIRVADPSRWRTRVERWLAPKMDKIVCVSQGVADFCRERGFPAEKLVVIPNGVDVSRFAGAEAADLTQLGLTAGRRAIVYVGRLDRQKGLDWLFSEVLPKVFPNLPQHDLLLVGDGPQRKKLESLSRSLGLAGRIHFAGRRSDVPNILAASDLLVLPSRWEGMPNVLLEAMAAGKPVVASEGSGGMEILGDALSIQVCPFGDADKFSERTLCFLQHKTLTDIGELNRNRVMSEFSLAVMVGRYETLYESLCQ